ncbi:hypothetical protein AB0N05_11125 [Nocardia sp. NPDC051030]|uniref:hypothetical protein n=1 Tax=Nocardia sp. NPDC051030 TaxID=3155162 RepID=UPI003433C320
MHTFLTAARRQNPLAHEPQRSTWRPHQWQSLLADNGFAITNDQDLFTSARALNIPARRSGFLTLSRVLVADRP